MGLTATAFTYTAMPDASSLLRSLKSLPGPFQAFDTGGTPDEPQALFMDWFKLAVAQGIAEPHAMTLSTVDEAGCPDARVLILKNLNAHGWHFAIGRGSPKGRQIAHNPQVALTFYWSSLGRQVRIRGEAKDMGEPISQADFLARPPGARAVALAGRQSQVLESAQALETEYAIQRQVLEDEPKQLSPDWVVYAVQPREVEFWQGDEQRRHVRLRYRLGPEGWLREKLWP